MGDATQRKAAQRLAVAVDGDAGAAPAVLRMFDRLGLTDKDLADALGVKPASVNDWRKGRRPIPRDRRIQMLAFLACAMARFEQRAAGAEDASDEAAFLAMAKSIEALLLAEVKRRFPGTDGLTNYVDDLVAETARVHRQLAPVWRAADDLSDRARVAIHRRPRRRELRWVDEGLSAEAPVAQAGRARSEGKR